MLQPWLIWMLRHFSSYIVTATNRFVCSLLQIILIILFVFRLRFDGIEVMYQNESRMYIFKPRSSDSFVFETLKKLNTLPGEHYQFLNDTINLIERVSINFYAVYEFSIVHVSIVYDKNYDQLLFSMLQSQFNILILYYIIDSTFLDNFNCNNTDLNSLNVNFSLNFFCL